MELDTSFYIIGIITKILEVMFAIRICSFKKDAWIFYLLATIVGSFQFSNFNSFSIIEYLKGVPFYCHDLLLPLIAILVLRKQNIKPQKITKHNLLQVCMLVIVVAILIVTLEHLILPMSPLVNIMYFVTDIFGIFVFIGSALLILGYISGLLISAIFSFQVIIMDIFFAIKYNDYSANLFISIIFSIICFVIFTLGYLKNRKLLST